MLRYSAALLNDVRLLRVKKGRKYLEVGFKGEEDTYMLPSELLRVYTTSAEALGHSEEERKIVSGKKYVTIQGLQPIGKYAVQITFSDGHSSGLYHFQQLHVMSKKKYGMMRDYIEDIRGAGLKRDMRKADEVSIMDKVRERTRLKKEVKAAGS
eukprot:TRINITY_DN14904_c0_g1_i2.p1 TRINITY_DN14904_c0_g1~~TRINITY_DN14904_c0_g1_i2.p1  ORF type:complete len:154 (+),score=11.81 TRINITY_DN14904_c0_g1_i2:33-494(+)